MSDRKLQFDSSNLSYEDAAAIAERGIKENSPFNVEEILKDQRNKAGFTSSNNSVSVAKIGNTIVVDLNGTQDVMDAIEENLNSQASGGSPARSGTGPTNPDLGGTGPDGMEFDESNPPSMPQPGEERDNEDLWYITVDEDFDMEIRRGDNRMEPNTPNEVAVLGPFGTVGSAETRATAYRQALERGDAMGLKKILEQRFWLWSNDDAVLVEVMTQGGERGKAQMPEGLAEEAERFGWAAIVSRTVPDDATIPQSRQPDYIEPRYIEGWEEVFQYLVEYTADEPVVPSIMDDEKLPMSQADKENRMAMAQRSDPQATAEIYENGVVSLNRDGSVDTLDTALGIFIERDTNDVAMGYMGEDINLSPNEIDEIVENTRRFLEENNG